ncbi:hypothetical protein PVN28_19130 [Bacillus licheniformis]|uniref:hypothetical protein n=1 Tax=Bacillus TaxID=1386 RepID=UPI001596BB71|nr:MULTISPECIES: hypothetical protein [Bacillus]MBA1162472.1 hypothetical protein [Bacillus licheniformis]MBC9090463.1 hypothetical protein [Bacillus sp. Y1]MDE1380067.1 hypothetical protein [Bacillus licheniformis]MDE1441751.1 hypothetical protein [Bacillus licheniformis]MDE1445244.1 hypothetical protein [Bacillus licheniformis]
MQIEEWMLDVPANGFRGIEVAGGLTNECVYFEQYDVHFQNTPHAIKSRDRESREAKYIAYRSKRA